jgi:transglutaminase-like putative cysteine protease
MSAAANPPGALLEVEHVTHYRYAAPVELAHHLAYLRPLDGPAQQVQDFRCDVLPEPMHRVDDTDRLGNRRSCFTVNEPHRELEVTTTSRVLVQRTELPDPAASAPWEAVRERLRYAAGRPYEPASEFVHQSPYVPPLPGLKHWAVSAARPGRPVAEVGLELMARVHAEFAYRSASTEVDTPLADVLARREGVCQDFAHLLIGALRSMGLAARYVSGYLLTAAPEEAGQSGAPAAPWLGADASHAWVALWCPLEDGSGAHWLELDPTNDVLPSTGHVRLAVGRDYGDVTPLRGVIRGGGEHQLEVRVRTERLG